VAWRCDIRYLKKIGQPKHEVEFKAFGCSLSKGDCSRAVLLNGLSDLPGNGFESLIPRDASPFSPTSLSNPLEGVLESVRVIDPLELCIGLSAERSSASRRFWISFNLDNLAFLDMNQESAASMIHPSTVSFNDHFAGKSAECPAFPRLNGMGGKLHFHQLF